MLKGIGLILIAVTGIYAGYYFQSLLSGRVKALIRFETFIENFSSQIKYTSAPIASIFDEILQGESLKADKEQLSFLIEKESYLEGESFSFERWSDSVNRLGKGDGFKAEDLLAINEFGSFLGKSDSEGQLSHCDICLRKTRTLLKEAQEEKEKKGKLYLSLGTLGGAALALLFI